MNRHPLSLRGGETYFLIVFHAIIRQISNYCFCAISSCKLPVCAISYVFCGFWSNRTLPYFPLSVPSSVRLRHRRDISTFLDNLIV